MTHSTMPDRRPPGLAPLDYDVDHVRGPAVGRLILEYGDYECPYSRQAYREIERVEEELGGGIRFAFRYFPLTEIHPHAFAAAAAAEAAAGQGRFWDMHDLLFHRQKALGDSDLRRYAADLGVDAVRFDDGPAPWCWAGSAGCRERDGVWGRAGHADAVRRRHRAPCRLRRGYPARGAGPMSAICSHTASIELTELWSWMSGPISR